MRDVIVYIEHVGGQPRRVSFEISTKAKEISTALGGKLHAVVLGAGASAAAEAMKAYPFDLIHVSEDAEIDAFAIDPSVDYLETVAHAVGPALIMVPYTMIGRDLGSRLGRVSTAVRTPTSPISSSKTARLGASHRSSAARS